jgi:hypothetical protein
MEIITVGILLISVLNFIAELSIVPQERLSSMPQLKILCEDVLRTQDLAGTLEPSIISNDIAPIVALLEEVLPPSVSYNIYLENETAQLTLYQTGKLAGEAVVAHRIVTLAEDGMVTDVATGELVVVYRGIYDLRIVIWHEPRAYAAAQSS